MPNLDLPVAGYDDPIVGNTDYALPVAAPIPQDVPRVYINSPGIENIKAQPAPVLKPVDHDPWANFGMAGVEDKSGKSEHPLIKQLFGLGGEDRFQFWPEKLVRSGLTAASDAMAGKIPQWQVDPETGDVHTSPQMIERALDMASLGGTGGLAGTTDATLGSAPFLRPALKYKEKLYKGKEGQQHMDVIPPELYPEFQKMAMSGEDISHYNFGFHNDKGQFLSREKALEYGINTGIIDPQAGKFGALTSTLMADSSKPGTAIEAMAKSGQPLIIRGTGAEIGHESLANLTKPDHYYRGMSEAEYNATIGAGKPIKSNESSSFKGEGTNFSHDARDAESYANFGRSDPRKTGTPNYLVEVKGSNGLKQWRDGYFKAADEIHPDRVTSVIKMEHDGNGAIIGKILKADSSKEAAAIQSIKEPFFSALEHNVSQIKQSKMTGDQWLGTLSNKPGVKPEELDWTGLKGFLEENKGKPVSKAQIEEHLANNKVELKEVNKGGNNDPYLHYMRDSQIAHELKTPADIDLAKKHNANFRETFSGMSDREILKLAREAEATKDVGNTKFHDSKLSLPGGENYREMLLTLPEKAKNAPDFKVVKHPTGEGFALQDKNGNFKLAPEGYKNEGQPLRWETEALAKDAGIPVYNKDTANYKSSHWDEPNILAHVRMNDRNIDGKKSLHLEEIQSDWHQQGRDKGYKNNLSSDETSELKKLRAKVEDGTLNGDDAVRVAELENKKAAYGGVPDAPFKKSWHELALKRMIREAAEKGYDRLSWTPGEAQAARYDLSKSVDKIAVPMVNENGTRSVRIDAKNDTPFKLMIDKEGKVTSAGASSDQFSGKPLSDVVGKEMADKIMKLDKPHEFSGEGLKIGGEGMKGFYDQIIPKALEKLGKEHGVKVKQAELPGKLSNKMGQPPEMHKIHYIDIPKSLKDTAMHKGFPLFSKGVPIPLMPIDHNPWKFTPVEGNPFEEDKKK